jgi:hypothetical protein
MDAEQRNFPLAVVEQAKPDGAAAGLRGVIDNITPRHLHGWAWNPARPEERVTVELQLGGRTIAETRAETNRADLLKGGIGDGRHAFSLPLSAECLQRRGEMVVLARSADGSRLKLPLHVRPGPGGSDLPALERMVRAMDQAQRRMQADLQGELRGLIARLPAPEEREALRGLAEAQARLEDRIEVLTLWLTRLDEHIADQARPAPPPRRLDPWQVGLVALLAGLAGLALSGLPGLLAAS